jgi:hypothetical protein
MRRLDMDEVMEFRNTILARQTEAEEALVNGDPKPRMELWSKRDPVTLFGAIGRFERFKASVAGRPVEPVTVRVTHIYRREEGEWRIVHRHADNPKSSHG